MNLPPFLGLKPENYDPETYEIPSTHHGTEEQPADKFSPFSVASTTAFWRYDPQDPSKLQSNTRIVRWSDGSLTLQIASQPRDHYRISTTALRQDYGRNKKASELHEYNHDKDSQHYLSAPHAKAEVLRLIHPFSAAMKILPSGEQTDEAVLALKKSLAAAEAVHDPFAAIRNVKEDPELAKKRAELAEKDKLRAERKREAQIERETGRKEKVLGRRGLGRGGVGLTVGGLEDEDGMPTAKARKPARRGGNRHGDIYSDDEDDGYPRGRTREDEYDQDDGFLAASDEEPEIFEDEEDAEEDAEEDDPDVDDLEIEGRETTVKPKSRNERHETPKRSQDEAEQDATVIGSPHARKKRRVIDDDDDE
jgi:RNA polymerase-associated protein LEO1